MEGEPLNLQEWILRLHGYRIVGEIARRALTLLGVQIPGPVKIGKRLRIVHGAPGLVVHDNTVIGDDVRLYQGVTLGRADIYVPWDKSTGGGIVVQDRSIICAGAVVLFKGGSTVTVGHDSVIAANAVVTRDVPPGEIWGGIPAHRIGMNPNWVPV